MLFSQRKGLNPAQKVIQNERIDDELRSGLWNILTFIFWNKYRSGSYSIGTVKSSNLANLMNTLWHSFFKKPIDKIPKYWESCLQYIRDYYFNAEWYEVYDFLEFIANNCEDNSSKLFIDFCNVQLERENSAYRFIKGMIIVITSKEEIDSIENAIAKSGPYYGVKKHLESALSLMSDRKKPDFRNSIKESISAIESLCNHIVGKKNSTLGEALKEIEKSNKFHPALIFVIWLYQ